MNFEALFVNPRGRTPRSEYVPALLVLVAVFAFYAFLVKGRTATFCMLVLLYPAFVLVARRLHDMGLSAWWLAIPTVPLLAAFAIWLKYASFGASVDGLLPTVALVLAAAFAFWGCAGKARGAGRPTA